MADMSRAEIVQFARANVRRVHDSALAAAKGRNHQFEMTFQDTMYLMFHQEVLFDEGFELPKGLIGPSQEDNTSGLPADLIEPAPSITIQ